MAVVDACSFKALHPKPRQYLSHNGTRSCVCFEDDMFGSSLFLVYKLY